MNKTLEVTFTSDGKFTVRAHGFKGASCQQASKAFEEALGEVQDRQRTAEFFQSANTQNQQRIGQ